MHFLSLRQVADYAAMLAVSANHLNKVVKELTGKTASESISEMLSQEGQGLIALYGPFHCGDRLSA